MVVRNTGAANPQASHHNLLTADGAARRPSWECHWIHISQLLTFGVVPVFLPFGQNTPTEGGLKVETEDTRVPWILASLAAASAISWLPMPTWLGIHAKIVLKPRLECMIATRWVDGRKYATAGLGLHSVSPWTVETILTEGYPQPQVNCK
jgi:hypothetical protein